MAITHVASSNTTYASRSNTSVTKPTGTVDGDLVVLFFLNGRSSSYGPAPTAPSGFTLLGSMPVEVNGWDFFVRSWVYYKVASSEGASWAFTHSSITTQAFSVVYRGVDLTAPFDVTHTTNTGGNATSTWTGLTTATDDAMLVALEHDFADTANNLTPPTGFTERLDVAPLVYAAEKVQASAGATGNFSHTNNNTSAESKWATVLVALRPAADAGVTGTLDASTPGTTADIAGSVLVTGTLSEPVPKTTADLNGTVTVAGTTLAATTPSTTGDATGTVSISGTLVATAPTTTATSTGSVTLAGSLDAATPNTVAELSGTVAVTGDITATTPLTTASITGDVGDIITGALDASIPTATASVTGIVVVAGTLAGDLPRATGSAAATVTVTGTMAGTSPITTAAIAGSVGDVTGGTLSAPTPATSADMTGTVTITGTLSGTATLTTGTASGTVTTTGMLDAATPITTATLGEPLSVLSSPQPTPWTLGLATPGRTVTITAPGQTLTITTPGRTLEVDA